MASGNGVGLFFQPGAYIEKAPQPAHGSNGSNADNHKMATMHRSGLRKCNKTTAH